MASIVTAEELTPIKSYHYSLTSLIQGIRKIFCFEKLSNWFIGIDRLYQTDQTLKSNNWRMDKLNKEYPRRDCPASNMGPNIIFNHLSRGLGSCLFFYLFSWTSSDLV